MKTQRGVGLTELMISITIGLLLALGLGQIFVSMKRTSNMRQQMSAIQNYERTGMMFLESSIQSAGYYPSAASGVLPAVQFPINGAFAAGQSISGTGTALLGTDTLSVQFAASLQTLAVAGSTYSITQGCSGKLTPGISYTDLFKVSSPYLTCTETINSTGASTTYNLIGGSTLGGLTVGLTGMTVLYGVDTTGSGSVTEYFPANSVANWANVKTANITLIFNNPLTGQAGQPATASCPSFFPPTTPYPNAVCLSQTMPFMIGL